MVTAIVGVLGALVGVLLSNLLAMLLDVRRRQERIRDVQTSLRAEIRSHWHRLNPRDLEAHAETIVARIIDAAEKGENFTPYIPREEHTIVFSAVATEIHILPNDVIDPVVLYYTHASAIAQFVEDLRADEFEALEPRRKIEMYRDYIAMKEQARELSEAAIRAIDVSLGAGRSQ